jgi:hypothetical protein
VPTIPVTDKVGLKVDLQFDDKSDAAHAGLQSLASKASEFVTASEKPLDQTIFHSGIFGGVFTSPKIGLSTNLGLVIKSGENVTITVYRNEDKSLFRVGGGSPDIQIRETQAWVGLSLSTEFDLSLGVTSPAGFGVCGKAMGANAVSCYALVESVNGAFPTLRGAVEKALSDFRVVRSTTDIRNQPLNSVCEWDVSGSFTIRGSYSYPFATSAFSLATLSLPFHHELQIAPALDLSLTGSLTVKGEFLGRCYRVNESKVQFGLYKKKESDLAVSFEAKAGLSGTLGSADLVSTLFSALPGANFDSAQMPDTDRKTMQQALEEAVEQGFSIALNSRCSASLTDEAAVLYEIDLGSNPSESDAAIDAALHGDWSSLGKLSSARELRNVLTETHESAGGTALNLLGIYDCASTQDFVRQCCILHDTEDGTVTITDKETAQRIAVASRPFAAQDDKLRKVLDEAFLATVAYTTADSRAGFSSSIQATQSLLLYNERSDVRALHKALLLGVALNLLTVDDLNRIAPQKRFKYFRLAARASFAGDNALRLFFADIPSRTAYQLPALKRLGREVLASLLDRSQPADDARWQALTSDAAWAEMEQQKFPPGSPASYSDWYDITFWARSIATVAPALKAVLETTDAQNQGDPTKNATFMAQRAALAKAVATVTRDTKAAFEKGWPLAVMFTLSGSKAPASFTAQWDGKKLFDKETGKVSGARS